VAGCRSIRIAAFQGLKELGKKRKGTREIIGNRKVEVTTEERHVHEIVACEKNIRKSTCHYRKEKREKVDNELTRGKTVNAWTTYVP